MIGSGHSCNAGRARSKKLFKKRRGFFFKKKTKKIQTSMPTFLSLCATGTRCAVECTTGVLVGWNRSLNLNLKKKEEKKKKKKKKKKNLF